MTQTQFLAAYRADLEARFEWAKDKALLGRFMISVARTIQSSANTWYNDPKSDAIPAAWRAIGGKGRPTLKALRALPL